MTLWELLNDKLVCRFFTISFFLVGVSVFLKGIAALITVLAH